MSRILSAVVTETRRNDEHMSALESGAAALLKLVSDNDTEVQDALADWLDFAIQMDPDENGKTQVQRRLEYKYFQRAQQAWIALNGNRTVQQIQSGEKVVSRTVDFCAKNNLAYWENRWETVKVQQVRVDEEYGDHAERARAESGMQLGINDGTTDMTPEQMLTRVRLEEARLNWALCKAEFEAAKSMYEAITSTPYVYQPFTERAATAKPTANNMRLAASLLRS